MKGSRMQWLFHLNSGIIDFWLNCCKVALSVIYLNSGGFHKNDSTHSITTLWTLLFWNNCKQGMQLIRQQIPREVP